MRRTGIALLFLLGMVAATCGDSADGDLSTTAVAVGDTTTVESTATTTTTTVAPTTTNSTVVATTAVQVALFDKVSDITVARRVPFTSDTARLESVVSQGGFVDVFHPVDPGPWPVVVFLHGASDPGFGSQVPTEPHITGGCPFDCEAFYDAHLTYLAERGTVVYSVNYDFRAPSEFPTLIDDLACVGPTVATTAGEYGGDPSRTVVLGHSRGATAGAALALSNFAGTPAEDCAAAANELPTVVGFIGLSGDYPIMAFPDPQDTTRIVVPMVQVDSFAADDEIMNTGVTAEAVFRATSAYAHLEAVTEFPFGLFWGTADDAGAREFTEEFAGVLEDHGHEVSVGTFEGRHWESIYLPNSSGEEPAEPTPAHLSSLNVVLTLAHG